jgi:hypothetical protein
LHDNPPPRANAYFYQLNEDARAWKPITIWVIGAGLIIVAAVLREWALVPIALLPLCYWLRAFLQVAPQTRDAPLLVGLIGEVVRHPILRHYSTGQARLGDGRVVPVAIHNMLVAEVRGEQIQVLIVYTPKLPYSFVLGARGVPENVEI